MIEELLKICLILASMYALFWELMEAYRLRRAGYLWIKIGFAIMVLYWAGYYLRSALGISIGAGHQIWVRAPLLITVMLIGASASLSWFRNRGEK